MKRLAILICVVLLMAAAFQAGDIIQADRFVVFNEAGRPVFVATLDSMQGGELAVFDAVGNETFAVHQGQITAPALERFIRKVVDSHLKVAARKGPKRKGVQRSSMAILPITQPPLLQSAPVLKGELVEFVVRPSRNSRNPEARRWKVVCRITNLTQETFRSADIGIDFTNPSLISYRRGPVRLSDLRPGESDLITFIYGTTTPDHPPNFLSLRLSSVNSTGR